MRKRPKELEPRTPDAILGKDEIISSDDAPSAVDFTITLTPPVAKKSKSIEDARSRIEERLRGKTVAIEWGGPKPKTPKSKRLTRAKR